jgi:wyosine [tRNA(Phe)-imidazoG37] synthetase (radical SAM superfamily)
MQIERQAFYGTEKVVHAVRDKVAKVLSQGERIDYLTFVPDGEPTLDQDLGAKISALKELGIPIAVIGNATLIDREDVREDLMEADWVSMKVDAVRPSTWRQINRPHGSLDLQKILEGMKIFAHDFQGEVNTETMLLKGINESQIELEHIASFLGELKPNIAYLSIPTRPPAEDWVQPAGEEAINLAYQLVGSEVDHVELLMGYEGNAFSSTGDAAEDLLSITAVHPMREDAIQHLLTQAGSTWEIIDELIQQEKMIEVQHNGKRFYLRRIDR